MAELENEKEKVPVPVRRHEQKVEQQLPEKVLEPRKQWEMPPRWHTY